jgi:hypothetical protein
MLKHSPPTVLADVCDLWACSAHCALRGIYLAAPGRQLAIGSEMGFTAREAFND